MYMDSCRSAELYLQTQEGGSPSLKCLDKICMNRNQQIAGAATCTRSDIQQKSLATLQEHAVCVLTGTEQLTLSQHCKRSGAKRRSIGSAKAAQLLYARRRSTGVHFTVHANGG